MKVEANNIVEGFKPVKLTITIESKHELDSLLEMSKFNVSIPDMVEDEFNEEVGIFLNKLRGVLCNF
jgi:hypothetical protein